MNPGRRCSPHSVRWLRFAPLTLTLCSLGRGERASERVLRSGERASCTSRRGNGRAVMLLESGVGGGGVSDDAAADDDGEDKGREARIGSDQTDIVCLFAVPSVLMASTIDPSRPSPPSIHPHHRSIRPSIRPSVRARRRRRRRRRCVVEVIALPVYGMYVRSRVRSLPRPVSAGLSRIQFCRRLFRCLSLHP